jgi:predicted nucleotidyltransferase
LGLAWGRTNRLRHLGCADEGATKVGRKVSGRRRRCSRAGKAAAATVRSVFVVELRWLRREIMMCSSYLERFATQGGGRKNRRMSLAKLPIELDYDRVAAFCRQRGIRKLSLFGSVLRDDFDPNRSDIDVLVEFLPGVRPGLKFFGYGDELAEILGVRVDFNTAEWLSKYFRDQVVREAVTVYEQA